MDTEQELARFLFFEPDISHFVPFTLVQETGQLTSVIVYLSPLFR